MILMYIFMILITDLILMFRRGKNNNDITTTNSLYDFSIFFKKCIFHTHTHSVTLNRKPYNERLTAVGSNRFSKTYFTMVPIHRLLHFFFLFLWILFNIQILIRKCLQNMKRTRKDLTN